MGYIKKKTIVFEYLCRHMKTVVTNEKYVNFNDLRLPHVKTQTE